MASEVDRPGFTVAVIGSGTMGRGIAQIAAVAGLRVVLFDAAEGAAAAARAFIADMIDRAAARSRLTAEAAAEAKGLIALAATMDDLAGAAVVCEAVVEDLEVKRTLFAGLEAIVGPDCVLASNTSSLSITAIAAACQRPERVAGFHFFNPVPLMRVVEVVQGVRTAPWVMDLLAALARKAGHSPVRVSDSPGFLVNNAGRGLYTEGLRIVAEGICDVAAIDDVMREGGPGFRMGPFELMDVTGLDVSHVVMESIYRQFYDEPRFRPQPLTRARMAAGLYGRKTGQGFYAYDGGKKVVPPAAGAPTARPERVWISPALKLGHDRLAAWLDGKVAIDTGQRPGANSVCLVTPLGADATTSALAEGIEAERTLAVDTLFDLTGRITLMTTPVTDPDLRDQIHGLLADGGTPVTVIHDSPGFIAQRMVATIVNIGCDIAQNRIALPDDIEQAVRLGLGYPDGPLGLGDAIGPARILAILAAMHDFYQDPRYRPSPWLTRRARLGVSLKTAEG